MHRYEYVYEHVSIMVIRVAFPCENTVGIQIKVAASLNYMCYGIAPARFVADPSYVIDPKEFEGELESDPSRRYPASALVEFRADWKFVKA